MNFRFLFFTILFFSTFTNVQASTFHVTVNANNDGVGTKKDPMPLEKALKQKKQIKPGDTILLHDGIYRGFFECDLIGSKAKPIVIMSSQNEWAIIDIPNNMAPKNTTSLLSVKGEFLIFKDFEIRNSSTPRVSKVKGGNPKDLSVKNGLEILGADNTFINLIIHDIIGNNIAFWKSAKRSEIYGCILYYAGWDGADRGHGYNIYTQNGSPEFKPYEYSAGKIVKYKGKYYEATKHHGDEIRTWKKGQKYNKSNIVHFENKFYVSQTNFSTNGIKPTESSHWNEVSALEVDSHLPTETEFWKFMGDEDPAGYKIIENNFIFSSHRVGISCYTESGTINNYILKDNTLFENGQLSSYGRQWNLLIGGINPARDIHLENNTFYFKKGGRPVQLGYKNDNDEAVITGNNFINQSLYLRSWKNVTVTNNEFSNSETLRIRVNNRLDPKKYKLFKNTYFTNNDKAFKIEGSMQFTGNLDSLQKHLNIDQSSKQTTKNEARNSINIVQNKYDPNKLHITIHNLQELKTIDLDLTDYLKKGVKFEVKDVQNYFGDPIIEGVYRGNPIEIPMALTEVTKPLGNVSVQPVHTGKELGTFILVVEN